MFPNCAGDHPDTDCRLTAELHAAGIPVATDNVHAEDRAWLLGVFRRKSGEVKTGIRGGLHGWTFERGRCYWICTGPGIEHAEAENLHAKHGATVRVEGHAGSPAPGTVFNGLAVGCYHVDDAAGLAALAETIKGLVARYHAQSPGKT